MPKSLLRFSHNSIMSDLRDFLKANDTVRDRVLDEFSDYKKIVERNMGRFSDDRLRLGVSCGLLHRIRKAVSTGDVRCIRSILSIMSSIGTIPVTDVVRLLCTVNSRGRPFISCDKFVHAFKVHNREAFAVEQGLFDCDDKSSLVLRVVCNTMMPGGPMRHALKTLLEAIEEGLVCPPPP